MKITLSQGDKILFQEQDKGIPAELSIGEGKLCRWSIPGSAHFLGDGQIRIVRQKNSYVLIDSGSPGGVFLVLEGDQATPWPVVRSSTSNQTCLSVPR